MTGSMKVSSAELKARFLAGREARLARSRARYRLSTGAPSAAASMAAYCALRAAHAADPEPEESPRYRCWELASNSWSSSCELAGLTPAASLFDRLKLLTHYKYHEVFILGNTVSCLVGFTEGVTSEHIRKLSGLFDFVDYNRGTPPAGHRKKRAAKASAVPPRRLRLNYNPVTKKYEKVLM